MKVKKKAVGLLALSVLAIALTSTAAAADYSPFYDVTRQGNILTITITSEYSDPAKQFSGSAVDTHLITIVMLPRGATETTTYLVPWETTQFTVTDYGVVFTLDRRDLPVKFVAESWVTGFLTIGTTEYTFEAAGPGWGWANIHQ